MQATESLSGSSFPPNGGNGTNDMRDRCHRCHAARLLHNLSTATLATQDDFRCRIPQEEAEIVASVARTFFITICPVMISIDDEICLVSLYQGKHTLHDAL